MTDFVTIGAAEARVQAADRSAWTLADAVLTDTMRLRTDTEVMATLKQIEEALSAAGITTPNGDAYLVPALATLRRTAVQWPEAHRHTVAAYRTHQEATTPEARDALAALARVAVGEEVERPEGTDAEAWLSAKARVERRRNAGRARYVVAANDLRIAIQRTPNVPRTRDIKSGVVHLLDEVRVASSALREFARRFVDADPSADEREAIGSSLERLIARAQETLAVVATAGTDVSDEALAALLVEEEASDR